MSWCRWGSRCANTIPQYEVDEACEKSGCPGSSLYVYESVHGGIVCCACALDTELADFTAKDEAEMHAHILKHHEAGHHVRRSLLAHARGEETKLTAEWRAFVEATK